MSQSAESSANPGVLRRPAESEAESRNPYVFLVGTPRSGTTMLKRMVDAHSAIAITRETHWIPRFFERLQGVDADGRVTREIVDRLFQHPRFCQMKVNPEELGRIVDANPRMRYDELVSAMFDRYARRKGKIYCGDKTPKYVRRLPTLLQLWPRARVVHLVRDGRNVCLSLLTWRMAHKSVGQFSTWRDYPVVTAAFWWMALVGAGHWDGSQLAGERYLLVRYEQLVDDPAVQCQCVARHLALPYESAMTRYHEGKANPSQGLSANAAWLPPTPGLRDWRKQLAAEDVHRFEAAAGGMLKLLGYPLVCDEFSARIQDEVHYVRQCFVSEAIARGWRLPPVLSADT